MSSGREGLMSDTLGSHRAQRPIQLSSLLCVMHRSPQVRHGVFSWKLEMSEMIPSLFGT